MMMRNSFMVTLLIFVVLDCTQLIVGNHEKCCAADEHFKQVINNVTCFKNNERRFNVVNRQNNFLRKNIDGECVDSSDDFFVFETKSGKITRKRIIKQHYFHKCCPLNFVYDSVKKNCLASATNFSDDFIKVDFVKVGLPTCKRIVDETISNVTHKENVKEFNDKFCIDKDINDKLVKRKCVDNMDICYLKRCIKKCCPDGQSFVNGGHCVDTYVNNINLNFSDTIENPTDDFEVIYNTMCPKVYLMDENRYKFKLYSNGTFEVYMNLTRKFKQDDLFSPQSYCIEHAKTREIDDWRFFYCHPKIQTEAKYIYTWWAKISSCIFLLITIVIYLVLNEMRNTFGKVLVNYCVADLGAMAILAYSQVYLVKGETSCRVLGYLTIYFSLAIFTWLNNLCIVVWRTFSSNTVMKQSTNFRKFLYYFLYGWGAPFLISVLILLFDTYEVLPENFQPHIGNSKCFFDKRKDNYAPVVFVHIPQSLLQVINTYLFVRTIIYFIRIKKEIDRLKDSTKNKKRKKLENDKERLLLIIKLSVIMGVFFIFEVVSSFFVMSEISDFTKYLEIVLDNFTCLQGVFIFIIFICKRKVFESFKRRFDSKSDLRIPKLTSSDSKLL